MLFRPSLPYIAAFTAAATATVVQWGTCADNFGAPLPVDCGRLFVPLDYTARDQGGGGGESLSLKLLRSPALRKPVKGSIVLNFGGPGATGRDSLAAVAPILHMFTGGNYNLIAFDPRGTGSTIPLACLDTDMEKLNMMLDFSLVPRAHERENLGRFWARGTILAEQCGRRPQENKTGALIGTAFTARDVVSVAEALGEDGLVRYWGFSYGTTLGATLVAMFPDKVDRVILDGVQNPHEYYHAYADIEEWSDSDEEFSHIFQHCVANPSRCALARDGVSAAALERSVWQLLERLKYHPVVVADYIIDRRVVSFLIVTSLYKYVSWPNLTKALDILIRDEYHHHQDDVDFLIRIFNLESEVQGKDLDAGIAAQLALVGIHCGDRAARAGSLEVLMPTLRRLARVSRVLDGMPGGINIPCAQWKFEPKERYGGDFQVAPRRPVLIVGNTWDGLTPLRSAHNVSSGFKGSVVLEVNGYGHSSLGLPSACNLRHVRAYWQNGTVPEPGTVCEVDAPPFSNITWEDVLRDMDEDGEAAADDGGNLELRRRGTVVSLDKALEKFSEIGQRTLGWRI
ncbi:hypothetical protein LMH87_002687 [Akanthomyces muscarius]|uniref:Peptidase S33 tripeptidyl aminopeptidase-like C-terminal domain-containing protein n=1 Tax=Akanthomyces muscarius TaxID=2231603 RepID=A0A9W8UJH9_AKAMU|nr:hypothetical protein LMH87_002687 [Akanthomyces muscarius]KAJ4148207.1 hypothetical protein LMH87_002687 [Akanthomyces muscarius]